MREERPTAFAERQALTDWLEKNRLLRHEDKLAKVAGPDIGLADLPFLSEEEIAQLAAAMTAVEARRFNEALQTLFASADSARDGEEGAEDVIAEGSPVNVTASSQKLSSKMSKMTTSQL